MVGRLILPATCAVGDIVEYCTTTGVSLTAMRVVPDSSQTIIMGDQETTATTGYLENTLTNIPSTMKLVCVEANTTWAVTSAISYEASIPGIELPTVN